MEGLTQLFDRKYQEYQNYPDEKFWADVALAQSCLLRVLHRMWTLWDRKAENAKQHHEEVVCRSHGIEQ